MVVARTILFKDSKTEITPVLLQHELVHLEQIARHGVIRFYLIYFCDYLANLWRFREHDAAYRHIRFEREARERVQLMRDDLDTRIGTLEDKFSNVRYGSMLSIKS